MPVIPSFIIAFFSASNLDSLHTISIFVNFGVPSSKVGTFLRKTSLDELPQLFSILIGNMSFIGPRPWIPEYYENMNDIPHSLFLGEDSDCCTKICGIYDRSAISYIMSKMVQCIEVYHNDMPIGNTMCYLAYVGKKPCLILDNIEIKKQFAHDDFIRDGIFAYAKQLVKDIGHKNMPIFLSAKRNDVTDNGYEKNVYSMSIIGYSGDNRIYIDSQTDDILINNETRNIPDVVLYPITDNCPDPNGRTTLSLRMGLEDGGVFRGANWLDEYFA